MPASYKTQCAVLLICISVCQIVNAEIYKWVDEHGNATYSDKKDSQKNAVTVTIKQKSVQKKYHERWAKQQKLLDVMQEERREKIALKQEKRVKKEKQKQKCMQISKKLKEMREASYLYEDTGDPNNPRILSNEERKTNEEQYQDYLKKHC